MFEYGALLNSSPGEQTHSAWYSLTNFLRDVPCYWYIAAIVLSVTFFKLLVKK